MANAFEWFENNMKLVTFSISIRADMFDVILVLLLVMVSFMLIHQVPATLQANFLDNNDG